MKQTLATAALVAASALTFSACNGGPTGAGTGTMPVAPQTGVPSNQRAHRNDTGSQDLHAGGADFPGIAYNLEQQPVGYYNQIQPPPGAGSLFAGAGTTGKIFYCLANSGDGRKAFEGGPGDAQFPPTGPCAQLGQSPTGFGGRQDPLDFVGSSVAMASTEYPTYKQYREPATGTNWGEPFEFPNIGGPIVYGFHAGVYTTAKVRLSAWSYCAIANGTISDWNDPALTADNGASLTGGASQPITFYFRQDSSGATYAFTNHLASACTASWKPPYNSAPYQSAGRSAAWTFGVNSAWPGPGSSGNPNPNFIGENGSPGIVAAIQSNTYATGYVEGAYAKMASPGIGQALLQNGTSLGVPVFVDPTNKLAVVNALKKVTSSNIQYGGASDGVQLGTSRPECVLYVSPSNFVRPPAKSYPIVTITYLLFYSQNNGDHVSDKQKLVNFLNSKKANNIVNGFEYASLSSSIETAVIAALNGNNSVKPCLQ